MWIPSKLISPVIDERIVVRERLLASLSSADNYSLVLINSPAGYGKTTFVSQWASGKENIGWFSLDIGDNQQESFASYLIAAIQKATSGHCVAAYSMMQNRQYASLPLLFSQVFIELADWQRPLYLIIDDYHLIKNPVIHDAMRFFLRYQPEVMTLLVLSRTQPPLGIAKLRVRGQLLEIGSQQLAFTHQEAKQFFHCRLSSPIGADDSNRLCDYAAGWVTALLLMTISTIQKNSSAYHSTRHFDGINTSHISDYLVEEVLNNVDARTRKFLLKSSLLRSMNDKLLISVVGEDKGYIPLEEIERQGLFLHRMDDSGEWFLYHPLFGNFLRQRCQREMATQLPEIHQTAAKIWISQGSPTEAIYHALAAGDVSMLREILLNHAWDIFNHGELELLEQSLAALPWSNLLENPQLILIQAWLMQSQQRYSEVNSFLVRVEQEMDVKMDTTIRGDFKALRAQVAINTGNQDEAESLARAALSELPLANYYSRIVATYVHAKVLYCKGLLSKSLTVTQQTEQMALRHNVWHYTLLSMIQKSEILYAQGFLQAAWEVQDKTFQFIRTHHLEGMPMHGLLLHIRAQILWSWARIDEAESCTHSSIAVLANDQRKLQCVALMVECSLACGNLDNARSQLNNLENLLTSGQYHSDWITYADKVRVIYWQMSGDKISAANWLCQKPKPELANNHVLQSQLRNIARAQILLNDFDSAEIVLQALNENARSLHLMSELNSNLILLNQLYWKLGRKNEAKNILFEALTLANRTGYITPFVIEGEAIAQQLHQMIQLNTLPDLEQQRALRILDDINRHHHQKKGHFDGRFVERLLNNKELPESIRSSPLTQQEWLVLGLIYSGYSNTQIASELNVATTTIKSHIRNLYQKIGVVKRKNAVQYAQQLLEILGYEG